MPRKKSFEKNLSELTEIVNKMENNELDIDESVKLYKEGITLANELTKSLQGIEEEIYELKKLSDNSFVTEKSDIE